MYKQFINIFTYFDVFENKQLSETASLESWKQILGSRFPFVSAVDCCFFLVTVNADAVQIPFHCISLIISGETSEKVFPISGGGARCGTLGCCGKFWSFWHLSISHTSADSVSSDQRIFVHNNSWQLATSSLISTLADCSELGEVQRITSPSISLLGPGARLWMPSQYNEQDRNDQ